ncbi:hypothetical protein CDIK_4553 [Cucumispora dikerogammari]|nr:hypothetical protein CDIK_4553 [Cucumispora dikerogammari]
MASHTIIIYFEKTLFKAIRFRILDTLFLSSLFHFDRRILIKTRATRPNTLYLLGPPEFRKYVRLYFELVFVPQENTWHTHEDLELEVTEPNVIITTSILTFLFFFFFFDSKTENI